MCVNVCATRHSVALNRRARGQTLCGTVHSHTHVIHIQTLERFIAIVVRGEERVLLVLQKIVAPIYVWRYMEHKSIDIYALHTQQKKNTVNLLVYSFEDRNARVQAGKCKQTNVNICIYSKKRYIYIRGVYICKCADVLTICVRCLCCVKCPFINWQYRFSVSRNFGPARHRESRAPKSSARPRFLL